MGHVTYSNHFCTKYFTCGKSAVLERGQDNPCYGVPLEQAVPSKYKRLDLFIQNQGTEEININFGDDNNLSLKLYIGQSINFDNYNGAIITSDPANTFIMETFA